VGQGIQAAADGVQQADLIRAGAALLPGASWLPVRRGGHGGDGAIRDGKYWPTPAELIERARLSRPRETTHGAVCEACQGSTWVETPCDGVSHGEPQTRPSPVHRGRVCRTDDVMHAAHLMATRCPGCALDLMPTHGDRA